MSTLHPSFRRTVVASLLTLILAVGVFSAAPPAHAAVTPPWRFTSVSTTYNVGYNPELLALTCPAGYTAISGGIVSSSTKTTRRLYEYIDGPARTFYIKVRTYSTIPPQITVRANCVWTDHMGGLDKQEADFARNSSTGFGGGTVSCQPGWQAVGGGAAWNSDHDDQHLRYTSPVLDDAGVATGWYASGRSTVSGDSIHVEVYCAPMSLLSNAYATVNISTAAGADGNADTTATCNAGYRILTGGTYPWGNATPTQDQGTSFVSGPNDARNWTAGATSMPSTTALRAVAVCLPASTITAGLTAAPAAQSTSRSGSFSWSSSDSAGEDLSATCYLDGAQSACSPTGSRNFSGLADGNHNFIVTVANKSGRVANLTHSWDIDATAPTVSDHQPASSIGATSPVTMTFSEPVTGASASSIEVHAQEGNVDVTGTISQLSPTQVRWTPRRPLVPGETYRVSLTDAIKDDFGNALTPTYWDLQAPTTVQNTSPALGHVWDVDQRGIASNGSYITSRAEGSRAELTFTATAGQSVSLYGIRLPNGGNADIYVDGAKKATRSFYSARPNRAKVYESPALSAGSHTISIRPRNTKPAASSGAWVSIDNLTVGTSVRQEAALRQTFPRLNSTSASGGSYARMTHATDSDAAPEFVVRVVGSVLMVDVTKTPASGKMAVYVDGVLKGTPNLRAAKTVYKARVFSMPLSAGVHTVRLRAVGTATGANSAVGLDSISLSYD